MVLGMSAVFHLDAEPGQGQVKDSQIAQEVQCLMPGGFVRETERASDEELARAFAEEKPHGGMKTLEDRGGKAEGGTPVGRRRSRLGWDRHLRLQGMGGKIGGKEEGAGMKGPEPVGRSLEMGPPLPGPSLPKTVEAEPAGGLDFEITAGPVGPEAEPGRIGWEEIPWGCRSCRGRGIRGQGGRRGKEGVREKHPVVGKTRRKEGVRNPPRGEEGLQEGEEGPAAAVEKGDFRAPELHLEGKMTEGQERRQQMLHRSHRARARSEHRAPPGFARKAGEAEGGEGAGPAG